jgi:hypothetical protein
MALRDKLLVLVDEMWAEAEETAARRSRVESRILRDTVNRILVALDLPERKWVPPKEEPASYLAAVREP